MARRNQLRYRLVSCSIILLTWIPGCAIAVNDLRRARLGSEPATIGDLKHIATAEAMFRDGDKDRDGLADYGSLSELTSVGLIDSELATGWKRSYAFAITIAGVGSAQRFVATASPVPPGSEHVSQSEDGPRSGERWFAIDERGTLAYSYDGPVPLVDGIGVPSKSPPYRSREWLVLVAMGLFAGGIVLAHVLGERAARIEERPPAQSTIATMTKNAPT